MKKYPRKLAGERFEVIDGLIDILLPSVAVGSAGAISGLPNFAPVRLQATHVYVCPTDKPSENMRSLVGALSVAIGFRSVPGSEETPGCYSTCRQHPYIDWREFLTTSDSKICSH